MRKTGMAALVLKLFHHRAAVGRGAVQITIGDALAVEPFLQQGQHTDELAEDQHAMAAVHDFLQQFTEQIQFAGGVGGIDALQFQQAQIAADLAQPQQGAQDQHAAFGGSMRADRCQHFLAAGLR